MTTTNRIFGALEAVFGGGRTVDPAHPQDPALAKMWGIGSLTHAGVKVDHESLVALPAVYRGINILSNGLTRIPFYVFQNGEDETKTFAKRHTSWKAVAIEPHPEITQTDFRKTMTAWAIGWGNAVAHIHRPKWPYGGPVELTPLLPDRTHPVRITAKMVRRYKIAESTIGKLYYVTRIDDRDVAFEADECLHIRGLGPNPYWGYDVVTLLIEAIGGAKARAEFGHRFYGQGAQPAGFIEMAGSLDEEAEARVVESLRRGAEGLGKAHRFMILEEVAKFNQLTVDPEKAQFLEGLQFDYRVLANIIGIKPHKLIDGVNSSYNSLEQANQEHRDDDLFPWILQWHAQYNKKMLTEQQRTSMSHEITIDDECLDGWVPYKDKVKGVVDMKNNDLITRDEGRRRLNFGPSNEANGKRFTSPMNIEFTDAKEEMRALVREARQRPALPAPDDDDSDDDEDEADDDRDAQTVEFVDWSIVDQKASELESAWLDKILARLGKHAVKLASKDAGDFIAWVDGLKTETAPQCIQAAVDELYTNVRADLLEIVNQPISHPPQQSLSELVTQRVATWNQPILTPQDSS